jgi:orotidine-5'-phosphate decarboxylase
MMGETKTTRPVLAQYKVDFIKLLETTNSLRVGPDFTLKSKRQAPHFINVGDLNQGFSTLGLAIGYSEMIATNFKGVDNISLYGIPEKGVPFCSAISTELYRKFGIPSSWFFTRKIDKTHGEATDLPGDQLAKSRIVGRIPTNASKIVLVDDVFTTGDAKYQAIAELNRLVEKPDIIGLVIGVDRQEVGIDGKSAIEEFTRTTGIPVYSIVTATDIHEYLSRDAESDPKVQRMATYLRVYGTKEAREAVAFERGRIITNDRSVIPACDMSTIEEFDRLVRETSGIDGIGGYKIGFQLGLTYGLPKIAETARKYTDKPLIYDHQKAGTDIPDTGQKFMEVAKKAGMDAVILFPQSGPETERAWIYRAMDVGMKVIVGGVMTHPGYLASEGGFINDLGALSMYRIAARAGVTDFVVPGTKPEIIKLINDAIREEGIGQPIFYAPGFGAQLGNFEEVRAVLGNNWHAIVGRAIVNAQNGEYGKAAEENVAALIRT